MMKNSIIVTPQMLFLEVEQLCKENIYFHVTWFEKYDVNDKDGLTPINDNWNDSNKGMVSQGEKIAQF